MVLADMKLAEDIPADVILFNIDSKSEFNSKENKDAIVNVFLKAFNQTVDDRPYKTNQSYDIGLRVLTPWYTMAA